MRVSEKGKPKPLSPAEALASAFKVEEKKATPPRSPTGKQ